MTRENKAKLKTPFLAMCDIIIFPNKELIRTYAKEMRVKPK